MRHEMFEHRQRAIAVGGPAEGSGLAEVVPEPCLDQCEHLFGHRVGGDPPRALAEQVRGGGLAVVVVKVPLAPCGSVTLHHQPGPAAHLAVEILHPQRLAAFGPGIEFGLRTQEPVVGQQGQRQRQRLEIGNHPPFAGPGRQNGTRPELPCPAQQFRADGRPRFRVVEPAVGHPPPGGPQPGRELAHRRKDQRDLLGMMADRSGLAHHLGHHHDICRPVRTAKRRNVRRKLVAQHKDQPAHHTDAGSVTSNPSPRRESPVTVAPRAASSAAMAAPMPPEAPMTSAFRIMARHLSR
jgi:hypothetical protein